jgi:hypothetical protein
MVELPSPATSAARTLAGKNGCAAAPFTTQHTFEFARPSARAERRPFDRRACRPIVARRANYSRLFSVAIEISLRLANGLVAAPAVPLEVFETPVDFAANPSAYRREGAGQWRLNGALMVYQWCIQRRRRGCSSMLGGARRRCRDKGRVILQSYAAFPS